MKLTLIVSILDLIRSKYYVSELFITLMWFVMLILIFYCKIIDRNLNIAFIWSINAHHYFCVVSKLWSSHDFYHHLFWSMPLTGVFAPPWKKHVFFFKSNRCVWGSGHIESCSDYIFLFKWAFIQQAIFRMINNNVIKTNSTNTCTLRLIKPIIIMWKRQRY